MKKIYIFMLTAFISSANAFGQTSEGNILIEAGFTPVSNGAFGLDGQLPPSTGIQFWTSDGTTFFSLGAEAGYFIVDDLAIKAGLGFNSSSPDEGESSTSLSYKIGAKYYINSAIPVQLDFSGSTIEDEDGFEFPDPFWLGIQAGYAVFLADNISFEPALRYNSSLNSDFSDTGIFELRFGFSLFF